MVYVSPYCQSIITHVFVQQIIQDIVVKILLVVVQHHYVKMVALVFTMA